MPLPVPEVGLVVNFSYLWAWQATQGQEEGVKNRPCVIAAIDSSQGPPILYVCPITHDQPAHGERVVEIPLAVKSRLGMDDKPSWIICSEVNQTEWPGFDLRTVPNKSGKEYAYGQLPEKLTARMLEHVNALEKTKALKFIVRDGFNT
jgi:hypothetical protein